MLVVFLLDILISTLIVTFLESFSTSPYECMFGSSNYKKKKDIEAQKNKILSSNF